MNLQSVHINGKTLKLYPQYKFRFIQKLVNDINIVKM